MMDQLAVRVDDLRVEIDSSGVEIDAGVCLRIWCGEVLGLVGESASGKTTVATSLLAYQRRGARIAGGNVTIEGRDILSLSPVGLRQMRGGVVSYVPQDPSMALNPALRIKTQLMEIMDAHSFGVGQADRDVRLAEVMAEVMLPSDAAFLRRYPHELSGGQQQRVVIAMAFACRPKVIVLDEPTTGLDVTTQGHVLRTVRHLTHAYGVATLYVTHDLAVIANFADRVAVMYGGRVVETGTRDAIFDAPLHPYTCSLLAAIPDMKGRRQLRGIPGCAPRPGQRSPGCCFAPRCAAAMTKCHTEVPPETEAEPGHGVRCWSPVSSRRDATTSVGEEYMQRQPGPAVPATLVTSRDLKAFYGGKEVLHGIDLDVRARSCIALVGESGSGKTTLARCLAGIHPDRVTGEMRFAGECLHPDVRRRPKATGKAIQYIFQSPYSSLNPRKTVAQTLTLPLSAFFDLDREETEARMIEALGQVALDSSVLGQYPDQLSGGERQRVSIARALVVRPLVLVCDEITSALDVSVQASIVELLVGLLETTEVGLLFVTHHLALVRSIADEVVVMSEGVIVERGAVGRVLDAPQADYTRRLLADTPVV